MERIIPRALAAACLFAAMAGCATSGVFPSVHATEVQLSEANFHVVAIDVGGEASASYILGVSGGVFSEMRTLALHRLEGTGRLYQEALQDLWNNFREEHGEVDGRPLALVNVRFDSEAVNLLLYTRPTVYIRADVIEFER